MDPCITTARDEQRLETSTSQRIEWREKRERQKVINQIRNRLHSIVYDVEYFLKPWLQQVKSQSPVMKSWPLVANQRCGVWYTASLSTSSCYFKSVDGHVGTWNFSLKRLNWELLWKAQRAGGCCIVDASRSKEMPDSLSRTIPIWAAVLNLIIMRLRNEAGITETQAWDDLTLYTPTMISSEERAIMIDSLHRKVHELYTSGVILQPNKLIQFDKPLRPVWITEHELSASVHELDELAKDYCLLVCVSCGFPSKQQHKPNETEIDFMYSCGAGDDQESWARGLTPTLFWKQRKSILAIPSNEQLKSVVDNIVKTYKEHEENLDSHECECTFNAIGNTGISIGTRRAGKPPECWENFDAILNVSMLEYDQFASENSPLADSRFYLQLPVQEGKRDKTELERWLAVGITFICYHLAHGRRVLVHCAQGRDRSVAVVLAVVALFCYGDQSTLVCRSDMHSVKDFVAKLSQESHADKVIVYEMSGLTKMCIDSLLGRAGRDALLHWCSGASGMSAATMPLLATKETIRVALQLIQANRPVASPSRNTLQKLNRFFMSDCTMYDPSSKISLE